MPGDPKRMTISPTTQGLIFDCDGTLVDSMPIHWRCWHETFASFGAECPSDFLEKMKGVPTDGIITAFNQTFGYDFDVPAFTEEKEERARRLLQEVAPIESVTRLVYEYHGRLPMAVASGGPQATVLVSLEATGLTAYFDAILTADDPVDPKPAPGIFLEAARRLNIEPEFCQVFEDGDMGLRAAEAAGMIATDVRPFVGIS